MPYRILHMLILLFLFAQSLGAQQYFPIKVNKKWGLINAEGEIFLQPVYDAIGEFKQYGYAVMQRDGRIGLLNKQGVEVLLPKYDDLKVLDSTLVSVMEEGVWKVVNIDGTVVLDGGYERVRIWPGSYICFMRDRKWGLADHHGRLISEPLYDGIKQLDYGFIQVREGDHFGAINSAGKILLEPVHLELRAYHPRLLFFLKENQWGAVDQDGIERIQPVFDSYRSVSTNFVKLLSSNKVQQLFSIPAQKIVSREGYDDFYPFSDSLVLCKKSRLMGLMDSVGDLRLQPQYNEIQMYGRNVYRARYKNKWGLVSTNDEILLPFEYQYIVPSVFPQFAVMDEGKYGIANMNGEILVEPTYDRVEIEKNEAKGYLNDQLSLFNFDDEGNLQSENNFKKHFTITIGGDNLRDRWTGSLINPLENNYLLDSFEWFYSSRLDKWGLRKLSDGSIQIEPAFDEIRIERGAGLTLVGIEQMNYNDFEFTKFRFSMSYGLVNNRVGLLVRKVDMLDVRFQDFYDGYPVARIVFNDGKHGLVNRIGKVLKSDYAFIGAFNDGLARMSIKGRLSGSAKDKIHGILPISEYLSSIQSPSHMVDYTLYDQAFEEEAYLICEDCVWGYIDTAAFIIAQPQYSYARDYVNEVGIVEEEGRWGMLDKDGLELLPCQYDDLHFLENTGNTIIRVYQQQKKYGLIDTLGQVRVDFIYDEIGAFSDNRLAVRRNGLWGFVDQNGRQVIPCRFRHIKNFSEGLAAVKLGTKWGFVDKQGDEVIPFKYRRAGRFSGGLAWVATNDGIGFIDPDGQMVVEPRFKKAFDFEGNVARVVQKGKYGLINKSGEMILEPNYLDIQAFDESGQAKVRHISKQSKYGLINQSGFLITKKQYREIWPFREGLARVKHKRHFGFIDRSGKLIIDAKFSKVADFSEGRAAVQRDGKCGYINEAGEIVVPLEFSKCLDFRGGKAVVYKGYRQGGIIDKEGTFVIEPSINRLFSFSEGKGLVRDEQYRFYYITEEAEKREGYYQKASDYQHGVAVVQSDGRWGVINQKGMEIIPPKYDKIDRFEDGYAKVRIKGFSGLTNLQGELLVQPNYEYISYAGEGLFRVEQGDKVGYFDSDGNWIWDLSE